MKGLLDDKKPGAATTSGDNHYVIFGDLDRRRINPPHCERGQNGRDGMFFVVENNDPFNTVTGLLEGESEMVKAK